MIILRYLVKETLKSQIAILFILLLIFICQNLVRVLGDVVDGEMPINLVVVLLLSAVPKMAQLILPLSLFLGLLITFGRLYSASEITIMHACGLGKRTLIIAAMILAILTAIVAMVNVFWINPIACSYKERVINEVKANPTLAGLIEGQFTPLQDGDAVLFISNIKDRTFRNVFLAQRRTNNTIRPSVIVAKSGNITLQHDGSQVITLYQGTRFEGTAVLYDFRITDFSNYKAVIGYREVVSGHTQAEQISISTLWQSHQPEMYVELHWRITLVVSVVLMALLVVPLSMVRSQQGQVLSILPIVLLYLIFFLLQTTLRSNVRNAKLDPIICLWSVNAIYFVIALVLNVWDTVPIRKLRAHLRGIG